VVVGDCRQLLGRVRGSGQTDTKSTLSSDGIELAFVFSFFLRVLKSQGPSLDVIDGVSGAAGPAMMPENMGVWFTPPSLSSRNH
jgi:hypothetical protein